MVKEAEQDVKPYFSNFPESPVEVRAVLVLKKRPLQGVIISHPVWMVRDLESSMQIYMT